jgi:hypothetical protein
MHRIMRPLAHILASLAALSPAVAWAEEATAAAQAPAAPMSPGFWVGAVIQGDIVFMEGGDLCSRESQTNVAYACFRSDREQYVGVPVPAKDAGFSAAYGTTRLALHVERAIAGNFTAGARFGMALGGGPTPAKGPAFVPLHIEARVAYWIGQQLSPEPGLRGFVFIMGGLAQVDASRTVEVDECRAGSTSGCAPATNVQPGGPNPDRQLLDAYKKTGQGFVGLGVGACYSFIRGSGAVLELKAMQLFPGSGTTFSPSLSYVFRVP